MNIKYLEKFLIPGFGTSHKFTIKNIIMCILSYILDYLYLIILFFQKVEKKDRKYYLSIGAIFKDESRFLKEWIEFHHMLGVDHFYLYNNFSSDDYVNTLKPYINSGLVTLIEWPYEAAQIRAYEDCYNNYKEETYWLTFIDIDEFFCPYYVDSLTTWLSKFEKYPSVLIYWKMFGTSGLMQHDDNSLVIEQYTHSWEKQYGVGKHIFNTSFIPDKIYHHYLYSKVKIGFFSIKIPSVNEFGYFSTFSNIQRAKEKFTIQLNHYWSKAYNTYLDKKKKGDVYYGPEAQTRTFEIFMNFEKYNISTDHRIWRYLIKLKIYIQHHNDN